MSKPGRRVGMKETRAGLPVSGPGTKAISTVLKFTPAALSGAS